MVSVKNYQAIFTMPMLGRKKRAWFWTARVGVTL
jgi:hypothetical protein